MEKQTQLAALFYYEYPSIDSLFCFCQKQKNFTLSIESYLIGPSICFYSSLSHFLTPLVVTLRRLNSRPTVNMIILLLIHSVYLLICLAMASSQFDRNRPPDGERPS